MDKIGHSNNASIVAQIRKISTLLSKKTGGTVTQRVGIVNVYSYSLFVYAEFLRKMSRF